MRVIVVGATGFVGQRVFKILHSKGIETVGTSRRRNVQSQFFSFEIGKDEIEPALDGVTNAIITASVTDYTECEVNPQALSINTVLIPKLISELLIRGIKTNYISSNTVFGGNLPWPDEYTPTSNTLNFEYALQKKKAEDVILRWAREHKYESNLQITRLTKVLDGTTKPFDSWFRFFTEKNVIKPFRDLIFAPITLEFAARQIISISKSFPGGIYHLSGRNNISYEDFCYSLARALNFDTRLIQPTNSITENVRIPFLPKFSGLSMSRTSAIARIQPQDLSSVVDYLKEQFYGLQEKI